MLTSSDPYNNDSRGASDFLHNDILSSRPETYGSNYIGGIRSEPGASGLTAGASLTGNYIGGIRSEPGASGLTAGASLTGYQTSFDDPNLLGHRRDGPGGSSVRGYQSSFDDPNLLGHRRDGPGVSGLTGGASVRGYQSPFEDPNLLSHRQEGSVSGLSAGAGFKGYLNSFDDPNLLGQRRDVAPGNGIGIPDVGFERANSSRRSAGPPVEGDAGASNVLFVDGLPTDCTRRELGHLFRPFIGFRELRVVHKEPRRRGDKAMVLCFVEFTDSNCARTALEALQGYKFDDKKLESPLLKLHFAHFPFRLPSDRDDPRV